LVAAAAHRRFARANGIDRVEFIILDLTPVPHMDSMGAHFLEELNEVRR
jgi:anti-anti-sigma regulatory factor